MVQNYKKSCIFAQDMRKNYQMMKTDIQIARECQLERITIENGEIEGLS